MPIKKIFSKNLYSLFYEHLPYILLAIYILLLVIPCCWFIEDLNFAHVRSFDDWCLSTCLRRTSLAFYNGDAFTFIKGLFDISYGPLFWFLLFIFTYPFLLLNSEPGILLTAHFFSLIAGGISWVIIIMLIRRYITQSPLIICFTLLPALLIPQVLMFQTSIHPDMPAILAFLLVIYFIMRDREELKPFSRYFTYAIIALCVGIAIKFNTNIAILALVIHFLINLKDYSFNLLKKHLLIGGGLTLFFHFPLLHYEILKHYVGRLLFLSQKAKELGNWQTYLTTIQEKAGAFHDKLCSLGFFICISLIGLCFLFLNRKKVAVKHDSFLFTLSIFFFVFHGLWVLLTNHVIWIHYALIGMFFLPIILTFIVTKMMPLNQPPSKILFFSYCCFLFLIFSEVIEGVKKGCAFAKIPTEVDRMEKLKLCKKINSAMTSIKYIFSVIGATPGLNLSPYSTTQVPEVLNIRTSYHFKNSYNFGDFNEKLIEALIIETGFHLHDKLDMEALPFMKQQSYASLYQEYYTDNQITIFVRRDILEKHYNALKVRYHYDGE